MVTEIKYVLSYVRPGRINRKFIIVSGKDFEEIRERRPDRIGKWVFSRYEDRLEHFYPYTGKDNTTNIINHNKKG
jgi:hypothetical protein